MVPNVPAKSHTKHVDISYKNVNEFIEDGTIKIVLVKSDENDSNIIANNLVGQLHDKH